MGYKFNPFTGNLDDVGSGGGGTPGGSTTQIQFNDAGAFGGDADLTWNKTTNVLTAKGDINLDDGAAGFVTTLQTITPTANRTISLPDATGTVALVGGSSGQLVYNNAGVNAGASTLTYDGSILTSSGRFINSYNSGSLAPAKAFTGTWATGAGTTNTKPHVLIETTGATSNNWSNSGTGFGVNAASGFAGNLLDLQVNGTRQLAVTNAGSVSIGQGTLSTSGSNATYNLTSLGGQATLTVTNTDTNINLALTTGTQGYLSLGSGNTRLYNDANNTLAQRNSTSAQVFRVYNTYTSSTNYELGKLEWSGNAFRVGTEKGSGGGTARNLELQTDGTTRATVDTNGRLLAGTTTARSDFFGVGQTTTLQAEAITSTPGYGRISSVLNSNDAGGASFVMGKTRGTAVGATTIVQNNDLIGSFTYQAADGAKLVLAASVAGVVDGTPSLNSTPSRLTFSTNSGSTDPTERWRITSDGVLGYNQPAPAAVDTTATLTVANLKTGIITSSTAAAVTMTLPTGTLTEGGFNGLYDNFTFEWTVINTGGTNAVTVQGGTGHTLVGSGTVNANDSGRFASRRTAANTFVTYRLS